MSKDWKPGDVVMVSGPDENEVVALRQERQWATANHLYFADWQVKVRRPLALIDPEDREAVQRFADLLLGFKSMDLTTDVTQAALREFANPKPPKPEEPTGLGAVVEDEDGERWTRVESGEAETRNPWYPSACDQQPAEWDEINAARVLSEGVQP